MNKFSFTLLGYFGWSKNQIDMRQVSMIKSNTKFHNMYTWETPRETE